MTQTREMRLKNNEITDPEMIRKILDKCAICRLGFSEGGIPYVIPINYGFTFENGIITLFFHSSGIGRKIDIIKENPIACFEIDCEYWLNPDENPGRNAVRWESLIGTGKIEYVEEFYEKRRMLGNMIRKFRLYNPLYRPTPLTDDRVVNVTMLKLVLDEYKAKWELHI